MAKEFEDADRLMFICKNTGQRLSDNSAAGDTPRSDYASFKHQLIELDNLMTRVIGYGQDAVNYALTEYRLTGVDVAAEYTQLRNAVRALHEWIGTAIPTGMALTETDANDNSVPLMFTTAQTDGYRTNFAAVSALIIT